MKKPRILIIAGSDPSGGAGLQIDIKISVLHKVYAGAVPVCLTAQNTVGVDSIHNPPIEFLQKQIEMVLDDIKFDAIKIGMLGNSEIVKMTRAVIKNKSPQTPIIIDPVMVATSGDILLKNDAILSLKNFLSDAFLTTPNIDEAQILAGFEINSLADMKRAALEIQAFGVKNVLIKAGHLKSDEKKINNLLLDEGGKIHIISARKIENIVVHGTGCALASAISCNIARGFNLLKSVKKANKFIHKAILKSAKIGAGSRVLGLF